ncbi:MAG: LabA-like NYN domain-containing protein [Candidatus Saccharimonadales bacterium]
MRKRFRKTKNVYAFIDSQNLNLGTQRMGWKMDWRKFRQFLRKEYSVTKAYMFIGYMQENESLYEYMYSLGYLVVLKPTLEIHNQHHKEGEEGKDSDKNTVKGNVDTEIVLTALKELPNYTKAIIVSGDGDFYSLIEHLIAIQKLAWVMTPNWQYSTLLKPFEKYIINLDKHRKRLEYMNTKSKSSKAPSNSQNGK